MNREINYYKEVLDYFPVKDKAGFKKFLDQYDDLTGWIEDCFVASEKLTQAKAENDKEGIEMWQNKLEKAREGFERRRSLCVEAFKTWIEHECPMRGVSSSGHLYP